MCGAMKKSQGGSAHASQPSASQLSASASLENSAKVGGVDTYATASPVGKAAAAKAILARRSCSSWGSLLTSGQRSLAVRGAVGGTGVVGRGGALGEVQCSGCRLRGKRKSRPRLVRNRPASFLLLRRCLSYQQIESAPALTTK